MNTTFERLIIWIIAAIVVLIIILFLRTQFGADGVAGSFFDVFKQGDQVIEQMG